MDFFYVIVGVSVVGTIAAGFILLKAPKSEEPSIKPLHPEELGPDFNLDQPGTSFDQPLPEIPGLKKKSKFSFKLFEKKKEKPEKSADLAGKKFLGGLFNKLKPKNDPSAKTPKQEPLLSLKNFLEKEGKSLKDIKPDHKIQPEFKTDILTHLDLDPTLSLPLKETGTASLKTTRSPLTDLPPNLIDAEDEKQLEKQINDDEKLADAAKRMAKTEQLLKERTDEFEKMQQSLEYELKNRKEFNKVKDLLEKEIKDTKDRTRDIQNHLNVSLQENENLKKRIEHLETKATRLEKEVLVKEEEIEKLNKEQKLTPATAAPSLKIDGN